VLIVGLGSAGGRHLRLARKLMPDAEIRTLSHREPTTPSDYADGVVDSIAGALSFNPQIAVIANPSPMHLNIANELANAGIHLLIEKPLSSSTKGVPELIETCRAKSVVMAVGYNLRFSTSLVHFKKVISEGVIGKVLSVRCEVGQYLPSWRPESDYRKTVSAQRELGGGVLLELSHELDYLRWIFGEINWVRATLSKQSELEIDVEDSAHLILGFAPSSDQFQLIAKLDLDFIRHDKTRSCLAIGETGTIHWDGIKNEVRLFPMNSSDWTILHGKTPQSDDSYLGEWNDFLESVNARKMPLSNGQSGLKVLEIIQAAQKSSQNGIQTCITTNAKDIVGDN
jgi:predicted dehydrogenase